MVHEQTTVVLCATAASIGFVHTALGPDHYVPFLAMSRAGNWSPAKTLRVTALCGIAHVLGSVILGWVGIVLGVAVFHLERIESWRGDAAGWLLLAMGIAYFAWGVRKAIRNRPHSHVHVHVDGVVHKHEHVHDEAHAHVHANPADSSMGEACESAASSRKAGASMTPWVLFTLFVFGPCEPLIPLLMYPAARNDPWAVAVVTLVFAAVTLATMLGAVYFGVRGMTRMRLTVFERYTEAAAGLAIFACGAAVTMGL